MRFPIRLKLLGALAIDLVLMMVLGYFATHQMATMNERAVFIERHTIPSLDTVGDMVAAINRYRTRQLEFLIYTNHGDRERLLEHMHALEYEMATYFTTYRPLISSAREQEHLAAVEAAWHEVVQANHGRFIPAVRLVSDGSVQPFYSRMNPFYEKLDQAMTALVQENKQQARASLDVVAASYEAARTFILFDTVMAIIISAVIGLFLSARIARRLQRLAQAANRVAAGNFVGAINERIRDEIGDLAQAFDQMLASLRSQRAELEERNCALQDSLARQEQLMAEVIRGKQAEAEAERARAAAEAASQAKSAFLATMSHELRTPLNAILGYAQLLHIQKVVPDSHQPYLERILTSGRHLLSLISNVLDFARIEQGALDLDYRPVEVAALVEEVVSMTLPLAQRHHNRIETDCPPEIGVIETDGRRLRQVLINLLSNAAKFTEDGLIRLEVTAIQHNGRDGLRFAVHDTGIGIPPDKQHKLFQPFSQVDDSVTRRYEGTGLGLALSKQIVEALGGTITVQSTVGVGSTFSVWIPVVPVPTSSRASFLTPMQLAGDVA
ncbi:sensor histidine kinase [Chloroflexus aggregans]|uniref:Circadian input-output histidine kinase CikA n=1 Tax=Chloroflexus aggregans (strain MD-66 / DSM 9485) TaxID=326427 RepID=B8G3Q2_CHLAD|nr:ATP-binding protein [Chloroflexus aggregans]ACL23435.1 histidine kinase [Chloroflexus aggregans DSM 9485]